MVFVPFVSMAQTTFSEMHFDEAMKKAKAEKKDILVDVVCGKVDEKSINTVLADKTIAEQIARDYITIRIDLLKKENDYFMKKMVGIPYPCAIFFTNKGEQTSYGFWNEMTAGRMNARDIFAQAKKMSEDKRTNTRKIEFRPISYPEALKVAKAENKLVFIDCVMDGCTPCRNMENNVFTLNSIADFYNQNFICIRSQREKDEYELADKYNIHGYPAFLFIKADGTLASMEEGFQNAEKFLALGQDALTGKGHTAQTEGSLPGTATTQAVTSVGMSSSSVATTSSSIATAPADGKLHFEKLTLTQATAMAAATQKLIYVNLSATWCGPCQQLKKQTFVEPSVIEFMNKNFINIAFECDVNEKMSMEYRSKFKTSAFPTHLIIDSKGELKHKFVGFHAPSQFIAELRKGMNDDQSLQSFNHRYAAGERSPEFMSEYIATLAAANEGETAAKLATDYLNTLPIEKLTERQNFFFLTEFARDIDSEIVQKVLKNKNKFIKAIGESDYMNYEFMLWTIKADSYIKEVNGKNTFDEKGYITAIKRMHNSGFPYADNIEITTSVRNAQRMKDWEKFVEMTTAYMNKMGAKANLMLTCNWANDLKGCNDAQLRKKYAACMMANFEAVKASGDEQAIVWEESINIISKDLFK